MDLIAKAVELAAKIHEDQRDKAGQPYILHPLRLMMSMDTHAEMMTAVLHDVIEDSETTPEDLRGLGIPEEVVKALELLSRRSDETYEQFIERIKPNDLARKVKLADLADNMDLSRLDEIEEKDLERLAKYHRAYKELSFLHLP